MRPVTIEFDNNILSGKYVYLYNKSKEKYELLNGQEMTVLQLDTEGKYLISEKKLANGKGGQLISVFAVVVILILSGVYIAVKKQYWFW